MKQRQGQGARLECQQGPGAAPRRWLWWGQAAAGEGSPGFLRAECMQLFLLQWERTRFTHVSIFSISLSFCPTFWEISSTFSTKICVERLVVLFYNVANLPYLLARPLVSWTLEPPLSLQK